MTPTPERRGDRHTRTTTAIRFPSDTHAALAKAAEDRDLSMNFIVNRAVEDYLDRLLPPDEMRLTRD